jgi:ketosteroid isomerase-like protein
MQAGGPNRVFRLIPATGQTKEEETPMLEASRDSHDQTPRETDREEKGNKVLVQHMFRDVLERDKFDEQEIAHYFSRSYQQKVDGKTLDFTGFVDHIRELKRTVTGLQVSFEQMVAEGNKVMDIHRVEADKRTGGKMMARVISLWVIEAGKIVFCDELTHMEQGAPEDRDLGSRTSNR